MRDPDKRSGWIFYLQLHKSSVVLFDKRATGMAAWFDIFITIIITTEVSQYLNTIRFLWFVSINFIRTEKNCYERTISVSMDERLSSFCVYIGLSTTISSLYMPAVYPIWNAWQSSPIEHSVSAYNCHWFCHKKHEFIGGYIRHKDTSLACAFPSAGSFIGCVSISRDSTVSNTANQLERVVSYDSSSKCSPAIYSFIAD